MIQRSNRVRDFSFSNTTIRYDKTEPEQGPLIVYLIGFPLPRALAIFQWRSNPVFDNASLGIDCLIGTS